MQARLLISALFINFLSPFISNGQFTPVDHAARDRQRRLDDLAIQQSNEKIMKPQVPSEWSKTVENNSRIPTQKYGQMQFYIDAVGLDGGIKTGHLISYKPQGQSQSWFTTYLATWNVNNKAWEIVAVNTSPDGKKTTYGVYYGSRIGSVSEDKLKPYYQDPNKYLTTEVRLAALEKYLSRPIVTTTIVKSNENNKELSALVTAPVYYRVKFHFNYPFDYGYFFGHKLDVNARDSIFLVSESDTNWHWGSIYLVDFSKNATNPNGKLFMEYSGLEPKPYYTSPEKKTQITPLGFNKLERLVNEQLGKITKEQSLKQKKAEDEAFQRILKWQDEMKETERKKAKEKEARSKAQGLLIKNAPVYTALKFTYGNIEQDGLKLKYPASDSFFIVVKNEFGNLYGKDTAADKYSIFFVNQKLSPGSNEGTFIGYYSSGKYSTPKGSKIFTQQDKALFSNMEKQILAYMTQQNYNAALNQLGFKNYDYLFKTFTRDQVLNSFGANNYYGYFNPGPGQKESSYEGVIDFYDAKFFHGDCSPVPGNGVRFNVDGSKTIFMYKQPGSYNYDGINVKYDPGLFNEYGPITITKRGNIYINLDFQKYNGYGDHYMITQNGDFYYGAFDLKGQFTRGEIFYANGDIYKGALKDSKYEGLGKFYTAKEKYEGGFVNGIKNGVATVVNADNPRKYTEEIYTNGQNDPSKTKKLSDGYYDRETGYYANYLGNNTSVIQSFAGDMPFSKGPYNSYAKIVYKNGNIFTGRFGYIHTDIYGVKTNYPSNLGILTLKNGVKLVGCVRNDFEDSSIANIAYSFNQYKPIILYPNKDIYFGPVNTNLEKDGKGIICYANGDTFIGYFSKGTRRDGLMIFQNGDIYSGTFSDDKLDGRAKYIDWTKKEKFCGFYKNGVREGKGILTPLDSEPKLVEYKNGVLQQ